MLVYHACFVCAGKCLAVDPVQRPSADALLAQLYNVADRLRENVDAPSVSMHKALCFSKSLVYVRKYSLIIISMHVLLYVGGFIGPSQECQFQGE